MTKITKKDLILSALIGLIVAAALIVVVENLDALIPQKNLLLLAFPILSVVGLWICWQLSRVRPFFFQLGKFGLIGGVNTAVDLAILNLLIIATGVSAGVMYAVFKGLSFLVAVINSYWWNKLWAFKARQGDFVQFLIISVIGAFINVGVASLVVNAIPAPEAFSGRSWGTIGALVAVAASMIWNFIGYKKFVFKN